METLGDAFLKYTTTCELYRLRPDLNEGNMTSLRSTYISNQRQCEVALSSGLSAYLRAIPLSKGERAISVCPPGMCAAELLPVRSVWSTDILKKPVPERKYEVEGLHSYPVRQHQRHMVMYKKLSDMVESVIGVLRRGGGHSFHQGLWALAATHQGRASEY